MKKLTKKLLILFAFSALIIGLVACGDNDGKDGTDDDAITLKVLLNWNGAGGNKPEDPFNNPIAKKIKEETGVLLDYEYTNESEVEKLTQVLATGEYPDIYVGPAWGKEAELMLEAGNEGILHDLTPYIEEYQSLADVVNPENMSPALYDNYFSKQEGGQYLLHSEYPATEEDVKDWLYGLYVHKDIADELGVDPQSITTPDDLYDFLVKVKEGDFNANGSHVFPMGAYDNGWPLDITSEMFVPVAGAGGWFFDEEDNAHYNFMTDEYVDWVLFMRKLMDEELLDPEVYSQTGQIAKEKVAQGRYAVVPNQFNGMWHDAKQGGLEEKYVPLGPIEDFDGDRYRTEFNVQGAQLIGVFADLSEEKLEAFVKLFDYVSSEEGFILTHYGIEGVHYDLEDGEIVAKEEMVEKLEDGTLKDEGLAVDNFTVFSGLDETYSLGGGPFGHQFDEQMVVEEEFKEIMRADGIQTIDGRDPDSVFREHPNFEQIEPVIHSIGDAVQQAIHAGTEEEALNIIERTREALLNVGIDEVEEELSNLAKDGENFMRYRTSN